MAPGVAEICPARCADASRPPQAQAASGSGGRSYAETTLRPVVRRRVSANCAASTGDTAFSRAPARSPAAWLPRASTFHARGAARRVQLHLVGSQPPQQQRELVRPVPVERQEHELDGEAAGVLFAEAPEPLDRGAQRDALDGAVEAAEGPLVRRVELAEDAVGLRQLAPDAGVAEVRRVRQHEHGLRRQTLDGTDDLAQVGRQRRWRLYSSRFRMSERAHSRQRLMPVAASTVSAVCAASEATGPARARRTRRPPRV